MQLLKQRRRYTVFLQHITVAHAISHILVLPWPLKPLADIAEQLIVPAISQVLVNVGQQLRAAHQRWDAHPALCAVSCHQQKDL